MTQKAKIKALAALGGWDVRGKCSCHVCDWQRKEKQLVGHYPTDYLTNYNSIIPLIQRQSDEIQWKVLDILSEKTRESYRPIMFQDTPQDLCDALLQATGILK